VNTPILLKGLRRILFSVPTITVVALFVLYLLVGYLALPAAVKWQAEKQVREKLGHGLVIGKVRFDPLAFEFEVQDLALSDAQGQGMFGLRRLFVDFELRRSLVDRAWTFAAATLEAPTLQFEIDKDGRHNFSALIERLRDNEPDNDEPAAALPRLAVQHIVLSDGRVEVQDRSLAEPTITRIEPLGFSVDALSTFAEAPGRYHLRAPSAAGEVFETGGELALNPVAAKGQLTISGLEVATLVRALSRFVAIDAPAGQIDIAAKYDLGVDGSGQLAGTAQEVEVGIGRLSLSAVGAKAPLLAIEQMALTQGRIDLGQREVAVASFKLNKGRLAASTDVQGRFDWATLARPRVEPTADAAPGSAAARPGAPAPAPWRVSITSAEMADIAVSIADASQGQSAQIDSVALKASPSAEVGPTGVTLRLDQATLSLAGTKLEQGEGAVAVPALTLETDQVSLATAIGGTDLSLAVAQITASQGISLQQGQDKFAAANASVQIGPVAMRQAGANARGTIDSTRLALSGVSMNQAGQSATLADLSIAGEGLTLQSAPAQFAVGLKTFRTALAGILARRGEDSLALRTASIAVDQLALDRGDAGLRIELATPLLSSAGARVVRGAERASLDELSIQGASASLTSASNGNLSLALQSFASAAIGAALSRGDDGLDLRKADLGAQSVTLALDGGQLKLAGSAARASLSGLAARQGNQRLALTSGEFKTEALSASVGGVPPAARALH